MNAQIRSDSYLLPEDGQKLEYEPDTKISNAGKFKIYREDHTIANLLRMQLLRDDYVSFSGYIHEHPLVHDVTIRIQTKETSTPMEAMTLSIDQLSTEFDEVSQRFKEAMEVFKASMDENVYT